MQTTGETLAIMDVIGNQDPFVQKKKLAMQITQATRVRMKLWILEMKCSSIIIELKESDHISLMTNKSKDTNTKEHVSLVHII